MIAEIRPGPVDHHHESISETDQEEDVDQQPGKPGEEARELDSPEVGDGGSASDGGEAALVNVVEWLERFPLSSAHDVPGRVPPLLDGHGRDSR